MSTSEGGGGGGGGGRPLSATGSSSSFTAAPPPDRIDKSSLGEELHSQGVLSKEDLVSLDTSARIEALRGEQRAAEEHEDYALAETIEAKIAAMRLRERQRRSAMIRQRQAGDKEAVAKKEAAVRAELLEEHRARRAELEERHAGEERRLAETHREEEADLMAVQEEKAQSVGVRPTPEIQRLKAEQDRYAKAKEYKRAAECKAQVARLEREAAGRGSANFHQRATEPLLRAMRNKHSSQVHRLRQRCERERRELDAKLESETQVMEKRLRRERLDVEELQAIERKHGAQTVIVGGGTDGAAAGLVVGTPRAAREQIERLTGSIGTTRGVVKGVIGFKRAGKRAQARKTALEAEEKETAMAAVLRSAEAKEEERRNAPPPAPYRVAADVQGPVSPARPVAVEAEDEDEGVVEEEEELPESSQGKEKERESVEEAEEEDADEAARAHEEEQTPAPASPEPEAELDDEVVGVIADDDDADGAVDPFETPPRRESRQAPASVEQSADAVLSVIQLLSGQISSSVGGADGDSDLVAAEILRKVEEMASPRKPAPPPAREPEPYDSGYGNEPYTFGRPASAPQHARPTSARPFAPRESRSRPASTARRPRTAAPRAPLASERVAQSIYSKPARAHGPPAQHTSHADSLTDRDLARLQRRNVKKEMGWNASTTLGEEEEPEAPAYRRKAPLNMGRPRTATASGRKKRTKRGVRSAKRRTAASTEPVPPGEEEEDGDGEGTYYDPYDPADPNRFWVEEASMLAMPLPPQSAPPPRPSTAAGGSVRQRHAQYVAAPAAAPAGANMPAVPMYDAWLPALNKQNKEIEKLYRKKYHEQRQLFRDERARIEAEREELRERRRRMELEREEMERERFEIRLKEEELQLIRKYQKRRERIERAELEKRKAEKELAEARMVVFADDHTREDYLREAPETDAQRRARIKEEKAERRRIFLEMEEKRKEDEHLAKSEAKVLARMVDAEKAEVYAAEREAWEDEERRKRLAAERNASPVPAETAAAPSTADGDDAERERRRAEIKAKKEARRRQFLDKQGDSEEQRYFEAKKREREAEAAKKEQLARLALEAEQGDGGAAAEAPTTPAKQTSAADAVAATPQSAAGRGADAARALREERELAAAEDDSARREAAAVQIQRVARGRQARAEVAKMRAARAEESAEQQRREQAAVKIQSVARGRQARKRVAALRSERDAATREQAAVKIQAVARGRRDRKRVAALRADQAQQAEQEQRQREEAAAVKIQSAVRGRQARTRVATMRAEKAQREKEEAAAIKIQSVYRGHAGRQRAKAVRAQREKEEAAAIKIQSVYRGHAGRQRAKAVRAQREQEAREHAAAVKIQSVFRGHQGRKAASARRAELQERRTMQGVSHDYLKFVRAIYPYDATESTELTIAPSDILLVIHEADGWSHGLVMHQIGLFPSNYVDVLAQEEGQPKYVRALQAYEAAETGELTLAQDDLIVVLSEDPSGWWYGNVVGRMGVFPTAYAEPMEFPLMYATDDEED